MSKTVKSYLVREYTTRLEGFENAALVSLRGLKAEQTESIRSQLRSQNIRVTVVKNALARLAFRDTGLEALGPLMQGANAMVYGAESVVDVARALEKLSAEFPDMELRGAVLDGQVFAGEAGVKELSKFPTRDEAIAQAVTLVLSPGRNLMGQIKGPGGRLLGIVKSIEDKLESGETISKVG